MFSPSKGCPHAATQFDAQFAIGWVEHCQRRAIHLQQREQLVEDDRQHCGASLRHAAERHSRTAIVSSSRSRCLRGVMSRAMPSMAISSPVSLKTATLRSSVQMICASLRTKRRVSG